HHAGVDLDHPNFYRHRPQGGAAQRAADPLQVGRDPGHFRPGTPSDVEVVRNIGVSILASAGIAGLVIGLAAQRPLSALLGGIQLSVAQPIRIGDTVVVEGETGTIEDIRLTYVVVKIWDLRRLVLPITYFLDKPFQNWSRDPAQILGTANLVVDFSADLN